MLCFLSSIPWNPNSPLVINRGNGTSTINGAFHGKSSARVGCFCQPRLITKEVYYHLVLVTFDHHKTGAIGLAPVTESLDYLGAVCRGYRVSKKNALSLCLPPCFLLSPPLCLLLCLSLCLRRCLSLCFPNRFIWSSYSFETVACLGRVILPVSHNLCPAVFQCALGP